MAISGVNGIGATAYAYMNSSKKTAEESNFANEVQKAEESQSATMKSNTSVWAGDTTGSANSQIFPIPAKL